MNNQARLKTTLWATAILCAVGCTPFPQKQLSGPQAMTTGSESQVFGGAPRGTLVGDYDARFLAKIKEYWHVLLDQKEPGARGKVIVRFLLHSDGRVSNLRIMENTAGKTEGEYCVFAIKQCAPFEEWSYDIRRLLHSDVRDVKFKFYFE